MPRVIGVDGAPGGWVAVAIENGRISDARSYKSFSTLLQAEAATRVVAVDMPIGLPTASAWPRAADQAARDFIGPLRSSVFVVPPQEVFETLTHAGAVARCRELGIGGISQQAWALRQKIAEVAAGSSDERVHEVHPEVSFAAMNGAFLTFGKRTWNGHQERRRILAATGIGLPDDLGYLGRAGVDDVLDAVAAAWTADRIAHGIASWLPTDAAIGPRIWY